MHKNVLKEIYAEVKNESDENQHPRILDYVHAVIKQREPNFFEENDEETQKIRIESIRRSVAVALKKLEEEKVLGKIGKYYVSKDIADEHESKLYLLDNLHPAKDHVLSLSKKMCIIALDKDAYISQEEKAELEEDASCKDTELTADLNDSTNPQEILSQVNALKGKIEKLQSKVDYLEGRDKKKREKSKKIRDIMDKLKLYIGADKCYNISRNQNNIVIMFDLNDQDIKNGVHKELYEKINDLIKEICSKPMTLTKAQKKNSKKRISC